MKTRALAIIICTAALSACGDVTETIFALGAGEDVVGVSVFCNYPGEVREARESGSATVIGDPMNPSVATILRLKPTIIFAQQTTFSDKLDPLRTMNLVELRSQTLDGALSVIQAIGRELGESPKADAIVNRIQSALNTPVGNPAPRVLLCYYADDPSSVDCVGAPNWQSDILTRLGGVNALADEAMVTPKLNAEHILQRDPDLVIEMHFTTEVTPAFERWGKLPLLRAVKLGEVHGIYGHEAGSTGPSLETFIKRLRETLEGWQQRHRARS
ncbi:MAG: helical backbone metal receptor [Planctomycetes bacterium]|nr:helical backbone metal receptor [Planctomycetota bacterium]